MDKILIVDDDSNINLMMKEALEREGFSCGQAYSGTECVLRLQMEHYDLVLLDLALPGMTGEEALRDIRKGGNHIPVIVVSAKDDLDSKVDVLSIGADDYVTKPFEIKEVVARIRVQLRKAGNTQSSDVITYGSLAMDREHFTVTADGVEVPKLTRQEFRILELLVQHPTRVYSKDAIYEYAWQEPYVGETKTLDVHMSNLRKKLKQASEREYIETIWGIGYRMKNG